MDISFVLAEKYFWTSLDFWRLGPRRFAMKVRDEPESYISAVQFLLASLIVSAISWTIHFTVFASFANGAKTPTYFGASMTDIKTVVFVQTFMCTTSVIVGSLFQAIIFVWPLRSPSAIEEIIKAKFYSSGALLVCMSSTIAISDMIGWAIGQMVVVETLLFFLMWLLLGEIAVMFVLNFYYDMTVTCAFARLKRRRFLEGWIAFEFVLMSPVFLIFAVMFIALAIKDHKLVALPVGLACLLPIALLVWYFKRRLPKVRRLVETEYLTYWDL